MNRKFTSRDALGIWVKGYANNDETATHFPYYEDELYEAIEKLAHYEDLEEQGRLIEQKQGQWIKSRKYYDDGYTVIGACSVCGIEFQAKLLRKICYCPHCGAKMDEVEK